MANDDTRRPENDFARLFAESERAESQRLTAGGRKPKPLQPGDKVRGKILSIGRDTVFVELQGQQGQQAQQAEAMLDLVELRDGAGQLTAAVGDMIDAVVAEGTRKGGMVLLRLSLGRGADGKLELAQAFAHRVPVEGTVTAVNKGGVEVMVAGARAFCPISQLELRHVEDAGQYVGQKLMFHISRYEEEDRRGPNIVLSRRALLEDEARTRAVETVAKMVVGAVLPGVVTGLKDYGAFVDIGGIEGMLHVSELGFARVARPSDVLSIGQHVSVQVIRVDQPGDSKRAPQVALSLKALETDPWETATLQFAEGSRVRGTVTRVTTFGAFVELGPGVEGLVHVSELGGAGHSQRQTRAALKPGDTLDVTVLAVDRERRRMSLSTAPPEEPLDAEARAVVERSASPSQAGKLGTLGDLFKNVSPPGTKR